MLELRIISPQENGFVQEIEWSNCQEDGRL